VLKTIKSAKYHQFLEKGLYALPKIRNSRYFKGQLLGEIPRRELMRFFFDEGGQLESMGFTKTIEGGVNQRSDEFREFGITCPPPRQ